MSLTTMLVLILFAVGCLGAFYAPIVGVVAYLLHYHISPEQQWWGTGLRGSWLRMSLFLALFTGASAWVHRDSLRMGRPFLRGLEKMLLVFLGVVWLSKLLGVLAGAGGGESGIDPPEIKMIKVAIFALILTHVATTARRVRWVLWAFVIGALYLGYSAYTAPAWRFASGGRLELLGGGDFHDANALAGHMAMLLPLIGVLLLRTNWVARVVCLAAGALAVNTVVLTRSRGAFVAMAGGMAAAVFLAPKRGRKLVAVCVVLACIGSVRLMDPAFWSRASTITASEGERDTSAQSRLDLWKASIRIFAGHPLGIGVGRFPSQIGMYLPNYPGKDAHNTFVLCYCELGIQGIVVFLAILALSAGALRRSRKVLADRTDPQGQDLLWFNFGMSVSLVILLLRFMTMSRLYSEGTWLVLLLPVCLLRAQANLAAEHVLPAGASTGARSSRPDGGPPRPKAANREQGRVVHPEAQN
jgi:O-antigen ligase